MTKPVDLTNRRFGKLIALEPVEKDKFRHTKWKCKCDCGNYVTIVDWCLKSLRKSSCGKCTTYIDNEDGSMICCMKNGKQFIFDSEDYNLVSLHFWKTSGRYVGCEICGKFLRLHRIIMNIDENHIYVDHKDNNPLNNRKSNLRICSYQQNCFNKKKIKGSSQYKGVYWNKHKNKWASQIKYNYKTINLGYFNDEKDAANQYNLKAIELFGEFANINIL